MDNFISFYTDLLLCLFIVINFIVVNFVNGLDISRENCVVVAERVFHLF